MALCLSGVVSKAPILDLATVSSHELAKAFKSVLQRDSPSFPLPQLSGGASAAS